MDIDKEAIKRAFLDKLFYIQGKFPKLATLTDYYMALAYTVRDLMLRRWVSTAAAYTTQRARTVSYLSAEYLIGPHLGNNLINLGIYDEVRGAIQELGLDFDTLLAQEPEPGLGNGGLGRLAACFIDSLATLEIPTLAYGIRYEFGIFHQEIVDGWQVEKTDKWLTLRQSVGDRPARMGGRGQARRTHGTLCGRLWPAARALAARQDRERRAVRHPDLGLPEQYREHACGSGVPKRRSLSTSRCSTAAITTAPSIRRSSPRI